MKQKTSLQRPVYLFPTQLMLNGVNCTCLIYSRPILLFSFFLFFFRLYDNVSAIRFMLSLVKYHNCFITIFLKEKTGKTYRYKHYLHAVRTCSYTLHFMLNCMCLLNPRSLIKYQSPEETDESRPFFKVNHEKS